MTQQVLCKLIAKGRNIYIVSERLPQMNTPCVGSDGEIRTYWGATNTTDRRIEATNVHTTEMRNVPKLRDSFNDISFDTTKEYWYYVYVLPNGKLKTIMSGTVVCLPAKNPEDATPTIQDY